jgi:hypothetical protein
VHTIQIVLIKYQYRKAVMIIVKNEIASTNFAIYFDHWVLHNRQTGPKIVIITTNSSDNYKLGNNQIEL